MLSISHLSSPPSKHEVTVCESDGQLRTAPPNVALSMAKQWLGDKFVDVIVAQEVTRPAHSKHEARNAFSAHTETPWQRVFAAYYEEGLEAAVKEVAEDSNERSKFLCGVAKVLLKVIKSVDRIRSFLPSPYLSLSFKSINDSITGSSSIVSIAWHPHTCTLAAVFADDTIRVFGSGRSLTPLLKHRLQKHITQVAWMPYSASMLAVGCEGGLLLWTLDPVSVVTRPSGSCLSQLAHSSTTPTTAFSWHPKGGQLVCVGGNGGDIVVWDVGLEVASVVHTGFANSITQVLWSPDGSRLLAATTSLVIKVFETKHWTYERWTLDSPLQSAVWSSSGNLLLFATREQPALFSLPFAPGNGVCGAQVASQVIDLTATVFSSEDYEEISCGGMVRQLAWDPRSERLAVVFVNCELIAMFHTHYNPQLHLAPGGFIRGSPGNAAVHVSFQQNIPSGSVFSIVWSSGQVQHVPLRYTSIQAINAPTDTTIYNSFNATQDLSMHGPLMQSISSPIRNLVSPTSPLSQPLSRLFSSP